MTMIQLLKEDHVKTKKQLQDCLDQLNAGKAVQMEQYIAIQQAWQLHMQLEETLLYPVMKKFDETSHLITESFEEHQEARDVLQRIIQSGSGNVKSYLENLMEILNHHIQAEERELFLMVEQKLSKSQLDEMDQKMTEMRQQLVGKTVKQR